MSTDSFPSLLIRRVCSWSWRWDMWVTFVMRWWWVCPGGTGLGSRVPPGRLEVRVNLFSVPIRLPGLDGGDAARVGAALVGVRVRA
jgi:hypothetical protein